MSRKDKNSNSERHTYPSVHSSIIYKIWKQPKCQRADEWIEKCGTHSQWSTNQPLKKKNEIMSFLATWMDLEIIIPGDYHTK